MSEFLNMLICALQHYNWWFFLLSFWNLLSRLVLYYAHAWRWGYSIESTIFQQQGSRLWIWAKCSKWRNSSWSLTRYRNEVWNQGNGKEIQWELIMCACIDFHLISFFGPSPFNGCIAFWGESWGRICPNIRLFELNNYLIYLFLIM